MQPVKRDASPHRLREGLLPLESYASGFLPFSTTPLFLDYGPPRSERVCVGFTLKATIGVREFFVGHLANIASNRVAACSRWSPTGHDAASGLSRATRSLRLIGQVS